MVKLRADLQIAHKAAISTDTGVKDVSGVPTPVTVFLLGCLFLTLFLW